MASTDTSTVLRRMLAETPTRGASGVPAAFKPLASLIEKLADRSLSLPLSVSGLTKQTLTREGFIQSFEPPILMLRLRAASGAIGLAGLCPQLRAALIEVQTTGKVTSRAPADRPATDADAAMCTGFIGDLFAQAHVGLEPDSKAFWSTVFKPDGRFQGARALALALDDVPLAQVMLRFDLGSGARQGTLSLLIPQAGKPVSKASASWRAAMKRAVDDAPVALSAVLHRQVLSLADVEGLRVGDTLTLPRTAAAAIMLEADETKVGPFKLGQISGQKALRRVASSPQPDLSVPPDPTLPASAPVNQPIETDLAPSTELS